MLSTTERQWADLWTAVNQAEVRSRADGKRNLIVIFVVAGVWAAVAVAMIATLSRV